ncbi:HmuY family protein [Hyalangium versicolor]|uniref:HmuY family protein n=1 Tax=Hyalangium versicolor TaxID=2861190 RepID=UPI001CCEB412|nr:HmuY family protein [Hyalangium versicolor]
MHFPSRRSMTMLDGQRARSLAVLALTLALTACDSEEEEPEPVKCSASPVRCTEQSIDQLDLLTTPSTMEVREEGTTSGEFLTYVDARAGGLTPTMSYTYVRFTEQGLTRVDIDDQAALSSTDWDIAFRRYVIRVNSGVSGPSCVSVAKTPEGTAFGSVTTVNSAWEVKTETYFTDTCEFVEDESGIGAPAAQLGSYWTYAGCLAMTGNVFVVTLADGRHVKLEVVSYYDPAVQKACDETGKLPDGPSGSAQFRVKWAFLK